MSCRMPIQMFKIYNRSVDNKDWIDMNIQQNVNNINRSMTIDVLKLAKI